MLLHLVGFFFMNCTTMHGFTNIKIFVRMSRSDFLPHIMPSSFPYVRTKTVKELSSFLQHDDSY